MYLLSFHIISVFWSFLHADEFVADRDVKFFLRIRNRAFLQEDVFDYGMRNLVIQSAFNSTKPTTFHIHGFLEDRTIPHHLGLSKSILDADDQNLFFVDWGIGAKTFIYRQARNRVSEVARTVGNFIIFLHDNLGLKYEDVTLVGFSLGAHIAGLAGKLISNGKVKKLIALDPAGPLFSVNDPDKRLSVGSAEYTECIHSGYYFGIRDPICHIDFYINSGSNQPNCASPITGIDFVPCSHARAIEVYVEALQNPKAFYGFRCESINNAVQGYCDGKPGAFINDDDNMAQKLMGIFHVTTNFESPYGQGGPSKT